MTRRSQGFTMIELLVTLAIIGMLVSLAAPRYFGNIDRTKEDVLREDLYILRSAVDHFYSDRNVYPEKIEDLVTEKYLRKVPNDPFTQSPLSWVAVAPVDAALGKVADIRSGAPGKGRNGIAFSEW